MDQEDHPTLAWLKQQRIHSAGASNPLPWHTAVASFMTIGDGARVCLG